MNYSIVTLREPWKTYESVPSLAFKAIEKQREQY
jgi:hypothetical protein